RVSPRMHLLSTVLVALGSAFSAVWIVIANSWQQTPAGYALVSHNGVLRAEIIDFWAVVFNPSSVQRLVHTLLGAYLVGGSLVASVSAWHVLKGRRPELMRKSLGLSVVFCAAAALALPLSGDFQARVVARTQPAKLAAFEGLYRTTARAPLSLAGLPDDARQELRFAVAVPGLLSLLVHHKLDAPVTGLDAFKPEDRPPVLLSFLLYHAMVGAGMALAALFVLAVWRLRQGRLPEDRLLLWGLVWAVGLAAAAGELGWCAAEVGRQPWIVYGLLRTAQAASPAVPPAHVLASGALFALVYALLGAVWLRVLWTEINHGPDEGAAS
ncbi:MAG: cytochrome ubiquinol oxidase subunit I, partial [Elusimicrobia bacterium]|nr:cytochrome ubiquinol oxidase subunit I [Elusimicrobiota bacterium]